MSRNLRDSRIGEKRVMNCGEEAEIVEYKNNKDVMVKFLKTGETIKCGYHQFRKGNVQSHFIPTVYGVGIVGLEKMADKNGKHFKSYDTWSDMIKRCYNIKSHQRNPTYKNCNICDEWLFYPNFKKWYEENYYQVNNEKMCLDKDILVKGNKIYSPKTCVFAPERINKLFLKRQNDRGDLPIGVCLDKRRKKYLANCNLFDMKTNKHKLDYLGSYNTPEEAFLSYKKTKEENIKQIADYYKDRIPEKLYNAMYKYEVHIHD